MFLLCKYLLIRSGRKLGSMHTVQKYMATTLKIIIQGQAHTWINKMRLYYSLFIYITQRHLHATSFVLRSHNSPTKKCSVVGIICYTFFLCFCSQ